MARYEQLRDQLKSHLQAAKAIADRATNERRDFTSAEAAEVQRHLDAAEAVKPRLQLAKADDEACRMLSTGVRGSGHLSTAGSPWAQSVAYKLSNAAAAGGVKALTSGTIDVPNVVEVPTPIPDRPTRVLDLIPTRPLEGNLYDYQRETARTSAAAPVADNAIKPQSTYTWTLVEDRARVVAHLSEPIPQRYFEDHQELIGILDAQMFADLRTAVEQQAVSGDGTGENFTGLMNTSGVLAQSYATDLPTTLRRARTALEVLNEQPTAWVFNPADLETLDLLKDTVGRFYGAELDVLMGGLPKVGSVAVPQGTAILGNWQMARLFVRGQANLVVTNVHGDLFLRNQLMVRVEGRYGFGCLRPSAFNLVDLTP